MYKGQLKSWKENKGFGFIESSELNQDTFIHISSLKSMSRKPKVGDFIYFDIEKQATGKTKAINCRIEGVAVKVIQRHKPRIHRYRRFCISTIRVSAFKFSATTFNITIEPFITGQFFFK